MKKAIYKNISTSYNTAYAVPLHSTQIVMQIRIMPKRCAKSRKRQILIEQDFFSLLPKII